MAEQSDMRLFATMLGIVCFLVVTVVALSSDNVLARIKIGDLEEEVDSLSSIAAKGSGGYQRSEERGGGGAPGPDLEPPEEEASYVGAVYQVETMGFPLGAYNASRFPAVQTSVAAIDQQLAESMRLVPDESVVRVEVTGYADATKVSEWYTYSGDMGDITGREFYNRTHHEVRMANLRGGHTRLDNSLIAFLRALSVSQGLRSTDRFAEVQFDLVAVESPFIGPDDRRVVVEVTVLAATGRQARESGRGSPVPIPSRN